MTLNKKLLLILLLFSFIGCSPKQTTTKECNSFKKWKFKPCPCGHWRRGATPVK